MYPRFTMSSRKSFSNRTCFCGDSAIAIPPCKVLVRAHSGYTRFRWISLPDHRIRCAKNFSNRREIFKSEYVSFCKIDEFVKSRQTRRHSKKLQMQGVRILRNEAYIEVRCNDER